MHQINPLYTLNLCNAICNYFIKLIKRFWEGKILKNTHLTALSLYDIWGVIYLCLTGLLWGLHRQSPSVLPMRCQMKFKIPTQHPRSWSGVYRSFSLSLPRFPLSISPCSPLTLAPKQFCPHWSLNVPWFSLSSLSRPGSNHTSCLSPVVPYFAEHHWHVVINSWACLALSTLHSLRREHHHICASDSYKTWNE